MSEERAVTTSGSNNKFIQMFESKAKSQMMSFLDDNEKKVFRFVSSMQVCFRNNPKLNDCTKESLFDVFLKCAEWGLYPSATTGECYVIPYKDEASFQLGYQGMITLAYRSGVKRIGAEIVYENDLFEYSLGHENKLKHVPKIFGDRGDAIGAYADAILANGEYKFKIMSKEKIFEFRAKSQGYQTDVKYKKQNSPWQSKNDPELNMWKKTCVKQLFKMLPKSQIMRAADDADTKTTVRIIEGERVEDSSVMSSADIAKFYKKLVSDGYSNDFINNGIQAALKRDTLEGLTLEERDSLDDWLVNQSTEDASAGSFELSGDNNG